MTKLQIIFLVLIGGYLTIKIMVAVIVYFVTERIKVKGLAQKKKRLEMKQQAKQNKLDNQD